MKKISVQIVFTIVSIFFWMTAAAQPGTLDPTFANDGVLIIHPEFETDEAKGIALDNNGRIYALTYSIGSYLLRFNPDGTPDNSFGIGGKLEILQGVNFSPTALAIDASGRIILYGEGPSGFGTKMYLYRLFEDGMIDVTFGFSGEVPTGISEGNRALLIQDDGKIVVGGQGSDKIAVIKRINTDGSPDLSFNGTGIVTLADLFKSGVLVLLPQPDGKLLVSGTTLTNAFIARLTPDGIPDSTFAGDGLAEMDEGSLEAGQGIALMPDGRIIVSGHSETEDDSKMILWAFLPDGSVDNSFGINGIVKLFDGAENNFGWFVFPDSDSTIITGGVIFNGFSYDPVLYHVMNNGIIDNNFGSNGVAGKTFTCGKSIQVTGTKTPDGKILLCGTGFDDGNNLVTVSQFLADGSADSSFGVNGSFYVSTADSFYFPDEFFDIAYLNDGKSLICGQASYSILFLMRLTEDGVPDSSYSHDGFLALGIKSPEYGPWPLIAQRESYIYIVGSSFPVSYGFEDLSSPDGEYIAIHKLLMDGLTDSSFGTEGTVYHEFQGLDMNHLESVAVQQDGKLLITGEIILYGGSASDIYLIRFNTDGTMDSTFDGDGIKIIDWGENDFFPSVAVRNDGKIVFESFFTVLRLLRLLPDGSLDPTFGSGGMADHPIINVHTNVEMLLQADNKILNVLKASNPLFEQQLWRINEDGTMDLGFADNGLLVLDTFDFGIPSVQVQADGKILCGGSVQTQGVVVLRYLNNGAIDQIFGDNGIAMIPGVGLEGLNQYPMRMQDDGKILVAGESYLDLLAARFLNDVGIGTDEENDPRKMLIYPNPVGEELIVHFPFSSKQKTTLSIVDAAGKIIFVQAVNYFGENIKLDVSGLPQGFYILKLSSEMLSESRAFIR